MKRRASNEIDSLELLLDTICDTFGGVLFVAVLVAVLVGHMGNSVGDNFRNDARANSTSAEDTTHDKLQAELSSLQRAFRENRNTLASLRADQSKAEIQSIIDLRREVTELTTRRAEHVLQSAKVNQELAELEKLRRGVDADLLVTRNEEANLTKQLKAELARRTRTLNLPKLRQTSKKEFPLIVRFGRLYSPFVAESSVRERSSNLEDFVVLDAGGAVLRATPKPYAGLPIAGNDQFLDSLQQKLRPLDNSAVYLSVGVWEDSFEQFQDLKEAMVRLNFEYRLIPIRSGEFIQEAPVKETLVQ